jgi:hypothetical protein
MVHGLCVYRAKLQQQLMLKNAIFGDIDAKNESR